MGYKEQVPYCGPRSIRCHFTKLSRPGIVYSCLCMVCTATISITFCTDSYGHTTCLNTKPGERLAYRLYRRYECRQGQHIFLFSKTFSWDRAYPVSHSMRTGLKRPWRDVTTHLQLQSSLRMGAAIPLPTYEPDGVLGSSHYLEESVKFQGPKVLNHRLLKK